MHEENPTIALIAPFLVHYRLKFYNRLQEVLGGRILFYFQNKRSEDGRPGIEINDSGHYRTYSNVFISINTFKLTFSKDLLRKIRQEKVKILIIEGASGNLTSWYFIALRKILRIKIIAWACGWQPEKHSDYSRTVKKLIERIFFNHVDHIITYSSKAMNNFRLMGITTPMTVAYNGIDTDKYYTKKEEILKSAELLRPSNGEKVFIYVGGLFKEKNVDMLIDCFIVVNNENPDTILWIIGNGPDFSELKNKAGSEKPESIRFWGRIEEGVDAYFAAADFLVLPGVGGLALNQAMLWETPCIVSEADGTEDDLVFDGITGFRFEKNSEASLIEAMNKALKVSSDEYQMMRRKAQELILTRSNTEQMVHTFTNVLSDLT